MAEARTIAAHLRLALSHLVSAGRLGAADRNAVQLLFYAAENMVLAVLVSEGIDKADLRRRLGNHQLALMIDTLPDACAVKEPLAQVAALEAYATTYRYPTPGGRIPQAPDPARVEDWMARLRAIGQDLCSHFRVAPEGGEPLAGHTGPPRELASSSRRPT